MNWTLEYDGIEMYNIHIGLLNTVLMFSEHTHTHTMKTMHTYKHIAYDGVATQNAPNDGDKSTMRKADIRSIVEPISERRRKTRPVPVLGTNSQSISRAWTQSIFGVDVFSLFLSLSISLAQILCIHSVRISQLPNQMLSIAFAARCSMV